MKKIYAAVIILFVFVLAGLGYRYTQSTKTLGPIFGLVPADVSQVMVTRYDIQAASESAISGLPQNMQFALKTIDTLIVAQWLTGFDKSLLLIDPKGNFDAQNFLGLLNTGSEISYIYEDIDGVVAFGSPAVLEYIKTKNTSFFTQDTLLPVHDMLMSYNNILISQVQANAAPIPDQWIADWLQKASYFVLGFDTQKDASDVQAHILYQGGGYTGNQALSTFLAPYISQDTIFALQSLAPALLADVSRDDIKQTLYYYLSSLNLTDNDYDTLTNAFDHDIGIVLQSSDGLQNLGVGVVFDDSTVYNTLVGILPQLSGMIALQLGLEPELIQSYTSGDAIGLQVQLLGIAPIVLAVDKNNDDTIVRINTISQGSSNTKTIPAQSIASLRLHFGLMSQLSSQINALFGAGLWSEETAAGLTQFGDKVFDGYIVSSPGTISLYGRIE